MPVLVLRDRLFRWITVPTGLVVAWLLGGAGGTTVAILSFAVWGLVVDVAFAVASLRLSRLTRNRSFARMLRPVAFSGALFAAGDLARLVMIVVEGPVRGLFSNVFTLFMLAADVVMFAAGLRYPIDRQTGRDRAKFWLDMWAVLIGAGVATWCLALGSSPSGADRAQILSALGISAISLAGVFMVLKFVLSERPPMTWACGAGWIASCALVLLAQIVQPSDDGDPTRLRGWLAVLMLSAYALFAAVRTQHLQLVADAEVMTRRRRKPFTALPYLSMAVMLAVLVVVVVPGGIGIRVASAIGGLAVISALVVVRQLISFGENAELVTMLDATLVDLRIQDERINALLRHSSDITLIVDPAGLITYVSPAVHGIFGIAPERLIGTHWFVRLHHGDRARIAHELAGLLAVGGATATWQVRARHSDGRWRWLEVICTNLSAEPAIAGIVCNAREVTEARQLYERLQHQASHDALTGLANRALFTERLELAVTAAPPGQPVSVMLIDLDDFKVINDTYGHQVGDAVLGAVAERLRDSVRADDLAARLGGDEFAVVLPGTDARSADAVARRFTDRLAAPVLAAAEPLDVRASIGVASAAPGDLDAAHRADPADPVNAAGPADTAAALLRAADEAMYRTKRVHRR